MRKDWCEHEWGGLYKDGAAGWYVCVYDSRGKSVEVKVIRTVPFHSRTALF